MSDLVRISIVLPTRGRVALARRFLDSLTENAERPDLLEVILLVDDDDLPSLDFNYERIECVKIVGERQRMGAYNAIGASHAKGEIIMLGNDDVVVETKGWDNDIRRVDNGFEDRIYLCYPNDGYKGKSLCTFPIFSKTTFGCAKDLLSAQYRGAFIDYHMMDVFKRLDQLGHSRLVYLPDVVFAHHHFRTGKSNFDQTYADRQRFGDDLTFIQLAQQRQKLARRLESRIAGGSIELNDCYDQEMTSTSLWSIVVDNGLPEAWRIRIFLFMLARSAYNFMRGKS